MGDCRTPRGRSLRPAVLLAAAVVPLRVAVAEPPASLTLEVAQQMVDRVLTVVERIRGLEFEKPVPVNVVEASQVRGHLLARLDEFQQRDQIELEGRAYALLQLVSPDVDLLEQLLLAVEQQVAGFYDPGQGAYYLVDRASPAAASVYTAHELTHALEDQHYDLDARLRAVIDDEDRLFARGAVHEGSATIVMTRYTVEATVAGTLDPLALLEVSEAEAESNAHLAELPPVLLRQLVGPYVLGAAFLLRGNALGMFAAYPVEDAARVFGDPPTSSEQILHPDKYWDAAERDEPRQVGLDAAGAVLGDGWTLAVEGTLGELGLGPLVGAATPSEPEELAVLEPAAWTNAAAAGWDGDRWGLWTRGESEILLWSTLWDSPEDARQFADALAANTTLKPAVRGDRVAVVAGAAGGKRRKLLKRMLAAAP